MTDGHDKKTGQFTKGNPGGPGGNRSQSAAARAREAIAKAATPEVMVAIWNTLAEKAIKKKDVAAAYFCFEYAGIPKAPKELKVDGKVDLLAHFREARTAMIENDECREFLAKSALAGDR